MKKLSTLLAFVLCLTLSGAASAQYTYQLASTELLPQTTVRVRVVVEKEVIVPGPYARFSQKYLGTIAPLSEKTIYSIKEASLDYVDPNTLGTKKSTIGFLSNDKTTVQNVSHTVNKSDFTKVRVDRLSSSDKSAEESAREAADMIFKLRRNRLELITGDAGEHVFGDGLNAALKEISFLENEYLALFLGKQQKISEVKYFEVIPEAGKNNYVAFRFANTAGPLPADDLSAEPVVLTLTPENGVSGDAKGAKGAYFMVADYAQATLTYGHTDLAQKRIPVFQFGKVMQFPLAK